MFEKPTIAFFDPLIRQYATPIVIALVIAIPFVIGMICYFMQENKITFKTIIVKLWQIISHEKTKQFFKIFLLLNIIFFSIFSIPRSIFRPYAFGKFFMYNAKAVNVLYIYPLDKFFGWNNIFAKPFILIRNGFYNIGLKFYPENEGEREYWWQTVIGNEYIDYLGVYIGYIEVLDNYRNIDTKTTKTKLYKNEQEKIDDIINEIYFHIKPAMFNPIKDETIRKLRYGFVLTMLSNYKTIKVWRDKFSTENPSVKYNEMIVLMKDFHDYISKNDLEKNEKIEKTLLPTLNHNLAFFLSRYLYYKYKNKEFNCYDPYVKIFAIVRYNDVQSYFHYYFKQRKIQRYTYPSYFADDYIREFCQNSSEDYLEPILETDDRIGKRGKKYPKLEKYNMWDEINKIVK